MIESALNLGMWLRSPGLMNSVLPWLIRAKDRCLPGQLPNWQARGTVEMQISLSKQQGDSAVDTTMENFSSLFPQEEKGTTEDEMAGWHYRLDGHEFE